MTVQTTPAPTKAGAGGYPVKKVPKNFNNYASVECGAKILGSNPEAKVDTLDFSCHRRGQT